jgi:hypothetical protein
MYGAFNGPQLTWDILKASYMLQASYRRHTEGLIPQLIWDILKASYM